jgi:hypothetical protein
MNRVKAALCGLFCVHGPMVAECLPLPLYSGSERANCPVMEETMMNNVQLEVGLAYVSAYAAMFVAMLLLT